MTNRPTDRESQPLLTSGSYASPELQEHACVENKEDELWSKMKKQLEDKGKNGFQQPSETFPIYRVPTSMREVLKQAHEPTTICIGPYHHHKQNIRVGEDQNNIQVGEEVKWRFLNQLISGNASILKELLEAMEAMEAKTRRCYPEHIRLDSHEFVEMMLLDCCFIIEFFRGKLDQDHTSWDDPMCQNPAIRYAISCELLFLENQLPFFVLQSLFDLLSQKKIPFKLPGRPSMKNLAVNYFRSRDNNVTSFFLLGDEDPDPEGIQHLLHLFQLCCIKQHKSMPPPSLIDDATLMINDIAYREQSIRRIPCATKLREVGIEFRKKENPRSIPDLAFNNGVMELPPFPAAEPNNFIIRNLVAMEQSFPSHGKTFTGHAVLMDFLITTAEDVTILRDKDITEFESEEKMAKLVNDAFEGFSAFHSRDEDMAQFFGEVETWYPEALKLIAETEKQLGLLKTDTWWKSLRKFI